MLNCTSNTGLERQESRYLLKITTTSSLRQIKYGDPIVFLRATGWTARVLFALSRPAMGHTQRHIQYVPGFSSGDESA
jgi:hypothetical protein